MGCDMYTGGALVRVLVYRPVVEGDIGFPDAVSWDVDDLDVPVLCFVPMQVSVIPVLKERTRDQVYTVLQ